MLFFFALFASCSDQGCIDADDFGEYESQTIEVSANAEQDNCTYDASKDITDSSQGSGVKSCFISGTTTVTDESGVSITSSSGCSGFTDATYQYLCIDSCVQTCLASAGSSASSAQPYWTSTDAKTDTTNSGVTLTPGSEIMITATGSVSLGDSLEYDPIYVAADNSIPHSKNSTWSDLFFDVNNSQTINLKFSGQWTDGADQSNETDTTVGSATSSTISAATYSGARRIVAYLIPHPSGYSFDTTQTSEQSGTDGVPLLPDPLAWTCSYSGSSLTDSSCSNKANAYTSIGYSNADDSLSIAAFPVSSAYQTSILTSYGGIIRWSGDGLVADSYDPFATASCSLSGTNYSCTNVSTVSATSGRIVGDLSSGSVTIGNPYSKSASKVSFKSLYTADNSCDLTITVTDGNNVVWTIPVVNSAWSTQHIALETGQSFTIAQLSSGGSCGNTIAVKFAPYHELTMQKSGFVRFTMLGGSGSCTIKGRIMNPSGTYSDDLYEYDNFAATTSIDPLAGLSVSASALSATILTWSNNSFVRKGQVIRFSPESWDGTWSANGLSRECGIGMAMQILPRPALLCKGSATDYVANPSCDFDYDTSGTLLGCKAIASECSDASNSDSYCPITDCQNVITCSNNGVTPYYQKTNCTMTANSSGSCTYSTSYSAASCTTNSDSCSALMLQNAEQAAEVAINDMIQCYDLENYTGKVADISDTGYTDSQLSDSATTKGLTKLGNFNGDYGNFEGFSDSKTSDEQGNRIFQVKQPVTFSKAGRLRFLMLDGSDFNNSNGSSNGAENSYSNNSSRGNSYGGTNGFKVSLSGTLDFNNGQWLQARLCQESSDSSIDCQGSDPIKLSDQPAVIDITAPTSSTPAGTAPDITSNYEFDSYGAILRTGSTTTNDCTADGEGVASVAGANFYCHTYEYSDYASSGTANTDIKRLRLTFQILDPEVANCSISDPSSTSSSSWDGIKMSNPLYQSADSTNTGQFCSASELASNSCTKEFYCANKYSNNSGQYYVNVKVKAPVSAKVSSIIGGVITPVVEVMDGSKTNCSTTGSTLAYDGVQTENPSYDSSNTSNTGAVCSTTEFDSNSCTKEYYCKEATPGQSERIYKLLIADSRYNAIVTMCFVVMFTFYGMGYLMGTSELNSSELLNRIIKIGLIYLFIGETGWDWFYNIVVRFFKDSTDYLAFMMASSFDSSSEVAEAIANSDYYDKSVLFSSVDDVFNMFFSDSVQKKISALLFASIFGWAYLIIIYQSFMLYVYAVANAILLYLTAQVFISILFTLGPIFFIFTLFNQTKEMFDNWIKQLIGFSLQQIFLLTTLAFFNMLMYEVIKMSLGYKVCWDDVWTINVITRVTLLSFWTIASLPPRTNAQSDVGNIGNPDGIPSLFSILFIWVIASLMNKFVAFATDLAALIAGGLKASEAGRDIADMGRSFKSYTGKQFGKAWEASGGKVVQRLDKALFDSGAIAESDRKKRKAQNIKDASNKATLSNSADKAVSDYKKNNGAEFASLSKTEQVKKLSAVRDQAMKIKGEELGLKPFEIEKLKSDKGFKYEGNNLFGAAASAAKQSVTGGRTLRQSLAEKDPDTKFSHAEAKDALKKMDPDKAKKFIDAVAAGNIEVGRDRLSYLNSARKGVVGAVKDPKASAASVGKGLYNTPGALAKALVSTVTDKEGNEAERQLTEEGAITRMAPGTKWARPDSEKNQIRARAKENAQKKKAEFKPARVDTVTQLEREKAYLESDKKPVDWLKKQNPFSGKSELKKEIVQKVRKATAEKVKSDLAAATMELKGDPNDPNKPGLQEARAAAFKDLKAAQTELSDYQASPEAKDRAAEVEKLQKIAGQKTWFSSERRKEAIKAEKQLKKMGGKNDSKLEAIKEKSTSALKAVKQLDNKINPVQNRVDELEDLAQTVNSSEEIREQNFPEVPATIAPENPNIKDLYEEAQTEKKSGEEEKIAAMESIKSAKGRLDSPLRRMFGSPTLKHQTAKAALEYGQKNLKAAENKIATAEKKTGIIEQVEAHAKRARDVLADPQADTGSKSYQASEELLEGYSNLTDIDEAGHFVKEQEKNSGEVEEALTDLNTVSEYDKFNDKFGQ